MRVQKFAPMKNINHAYNLWDKCGGLTNAGKVSVPRPFPSSSHRGAGLSRIKTLETPNTARCLGVLCDLRLPFSAANPSSCDKFRLLLA